MALEWKKIGIKQVKVFHGHWVRVGCLVFYFYPHFHLIKSACLGIGSNVTYHEPVCFFLFHPGSSTQQCVYDKYWTITPLPVPWTHTHTHAYNVKIVLRIERHHCSKASVTECHSAMTCRLGMPQTVSWANDKQLLTDMSYQVLTHLPLDKLTAISQTTVSNAFSWMKSMIFRFKFH